MPIYSITGVYAVQTTKRNQNLGMRTPMCYIDFFRLKYFLVHMTMYLAYLHLYTEEHVSCTKDVHFTILTSCSEQALLVTGHFRVHALEHAVSCASFFLWHRLL